MRFGDSTNYATVRQTGSASAEVMSSAGRIDFKAATAYYRFYDTGPTEYGQLYHDGSNFIITTSAGNVQVDDNLDIGGGYGSTGVTISSAGAIQANGAITTDAGLVVAGTCATAGINFSAAQLNDIKSVYNISSQLGQYVQGIKLEHTRSADIQPSTGGWWGAQFVLNAGTGYTALDQPAYVLQCIFKGDATDPNTDCVNVGRFETQSDGKVEDLLFVSANAGSTVTGDIGRFVAHVAPTRSILALQNGTVGSTPAALYIDADETMTSAVVIDNGAVVTNFLYVVSSARAPYSSTDISTNTEQGHLVVKVGANTWGIPLYSTS